MNISGPYDLEAEFDVQINPVNPDNLVLCVSNVNDTNFNIYYTFDGGNTWDISNTHSFQNAAYSDLVGDPVLSFDSNGTLLLTFLAASYNNTIDACIAYSK